MEVILNQTVDKLGRAGEVVKVKPGYARNYLLPNNIALVANKQNLALVEKIKEKQKTIEEKERAELTALAEKLKKVPCEIEVLIGEEGKMFGSVTAQDIADVYKEAGYTLEKKKIQLVQPIKEAGEHDVEIRLSMDVVVPIKVKVIGKEKA